MISIPMIYVNPVTGPYAGEKMFCYVCNFNTSSVIAVFVKPDALEEPGLIEATQKLKDHNPKLESFIVCLSGPSKDLESKLVALSERKNLKIPLAVLPSEEAKRSIYQSLPIKPESNFSILLYRGRQVKMIKEDESFFTDISPALFRTKMNLNNEALTAMIDIQSNSLLPAEDIDRMINISPKIIDSFLDASPTFKELDNAAKVMIG